MSKTDWEAVDMEIKAYFCNWGCFSEKFYNDLVAKHTHRTEDDLPKNTWVWVKHPCESRHVLVYFNDEHRIRFAFTYYGTAIDENWYHERRLDLEIGHEIVPPGDGNHGA